MPQFDTGLEKPVLSGLILPADLTAAQKLCDAQSRNSGHPF
jgi:hypothetical protein